MTAAEEKALKDRRRAAVLQIMQDSDGDYMRPQVIADELGISLICASGLMKDMWRERILDAVQRLNSSNTSTENHFRIKQPTMLSRPWRKSYKWNPKKFYDLGAPM